MAESKSSTFSVISESLDSLEKPIVLAMIDLLRYQEAVEGFVG